MWDFPRLGAEENDSGECAGLISVVELIKSVNIGLVFNAGRSVTSDRPDNHYRCDHEDRFSLCTRLYNCVSEGAVPPKVVMPPQRRRRRMCLRLSPILMRSHWTDVPIDQRGVYKTRHTCINQLICCYF